MISDARLLASIADAMCHQEDALPGAVKTQVDLDRYKVAIADTRPDLIIECGTFRGVSALWLAEQAACPVVTIDISPQVPIEMGARWGGRVQLMIGSSVDPQLVAEVRRLAEPCQRRMVVLDSDHSTSHVAAELDAYAPLVSPGCYLVVEDTLVRWMPWFAISGSPLDAVEAFLATPLGGEFWIDRGLEDLHPTTQHPDGWLRRREP